MTVSERETATASTAAPTDVPAPSIERVHAGSWLHLGLPRLFEWTRVHLPVPNLPTGLVGLRLLHLSDLHLRERWATGYDRLIELVRHDPPDLICFSGDFVEDKRDHRPALPTLRRLLPELPSRLGTFAVVGNHDNDVLAATLPSLGVRYIQHQRVVVPVGGGDESAVELLGFPGVDRKDLDKHFLRDLPPKDANHVRVVLCHFPDLFEKIAPACRPDLFLAGHTHGGQVCLPNGWPAITHDALPRACAKGIHRRDNAWLIVSRGFGAGKILVRVFCPPQVMEIVLRPAVQ